MSKIHTLRILLYGLLAVSLMLSLFASLGKMMIDLGDIIYIDAPDNGFYGSSQTASITFDGTRKILIVGCVLCEAILVKHRKTSSSSLAAMLCGIRVIPLALILIPAWLIPSEHIHYSPNVWGILWMLCGIASFVLHILIRRQKKAIDATHPPIPEAEGEWVYVSK